jgi:hypothetical protein
LSRVSTPVESIFTRRRHRALPPVMSTINV